MGLSASRRCPRATSRRARPRPRRCDRTSHADGSNVDRPPSAASRRARRVHRGRARSAPARPTRAGSPPRPRPAGHRSRAPSPATSRTRAGRPQRSCRRGPTGRDVERSERVRALVGVHPEHDHDPRPHPFRPDAGRPADRACWGRCHAPIKSRRTSPTGDERHNKRRSGPRADSLKESQLAARSGPSPPRRTSPRPIETASLEAMAPPRPPRLLRVVHGASVLAPDPFRFWSFSERRVRA